MQTDPNSALVDPIISNRSNAMLQWVKICPECNTFLWQLVNWKGQMSLVRPQSQEIAGNSVKVRTVGCT